MLWQYKCVVLSGGLYSEVVAAILGVYLLISGSND